MCRSKIEGEDIAEANEVEDRKAEDLIEKLDECKKENRRLKSKVERLEKKQQNLSKLIEFLRQRRPIIPLYSSARSIPQEDGCGEEEERKTSDRRPIYVL